MWILTKIQILYLPTSSFNPKWLSLEMYLMLLRPTLLIRLRDLQWPDANLGPLLLEAIVQAIDQPPSIKKYFTLFFSGHDEDLALSSHIVSKNLGLDMFRVGRSKPSSDTTPPASAAAESRRPSLQRWSQQSQAKQRSLFRQFGGWLFWLSGD